MISILLSPKESMSYLSVSTGITFKKVLLLILPIASSEWGPHPADAFLSFSYPQIPIPKALFLCFSNVYSRNNGLRITSQISTYIVGALTSSYIRSARQSHTASVPPVDKRFASLIDAHVKS